MKYITRSCPHCRSSYDVMSMQKIYLGSPIRTCKKCGKVFHDPDAYEAAFLTDRQKTPKKISTGTELTLAVSFIILLMGVVFSTIFELFLSGFAVLLIGICMCVYDIVSYSDRLDALRKEIAESEKRVSNPMYVYSLMKLDYEIPKKYMDIAKPFIESIEARKQRS